MSVLSQVAAVVREYGPGDATTLLYFWAITEAHRVERIASATAFSAALSTCRRLGYVVATGERRHRVYSVDATCREPGRKPPMARCVTCPRCGERVPVGTPRSRAKNS